MMLKERHEKLTAYLLMKVEEKDWHGVSDAANDLRVLEAQMDTKQALLTPDELEKAFRKADEDWNINGRIKRNDESLRGVDVVKWIFNKVAFELGLS